MAVFECTITTLFVCSFEDKKEYAAKYMQAHPFLMKAMSVKKKDNKDAAKEPVAAAEGKGDDELAA